MLRLTTRLYLILCCLIGSLSISIAYALPLVDSTSTGQGNNSTTLTISHTTSGNDRLMLVAVSTRPEDNPGSGGSREQAQTITYNGVSLTRQAEVHLEDDSRTELWSLVAPPTGTHDVVITFDEVIEHGYIAGVTTFTGVDQANPMSTPVTNSGNNSRPATITVASTNTALVYAAASAEVDTSITLFGPDIGQDVLWNLNQKERSGNDRGDSAGGTKPGASNVSFTWDMPVSDDWTTVGVSINAVAVSTPIADWRMDETIWIGAANEVVDSSGNNYHGVANGAAFPVPGHLCNAADLTANSITDYLSMNIAALNNRTNFTISFWGKTSNTGNQTPISGYGTSGDDAQIWFTNNTNFQPWIGGSSQGNIAIPNTADNQFHHWVWTRSGTTNCFYTDGALNGCVIGSDASPTSILADSLIIGQEMDAAAPGYNFSVSQDWEGLIDEMLIFDVALSAGEVAQGYANQLAKNNWDGTPRTCPTSTASVQFHLDESSWSGNGSVKDTGGTSNHGDPVGTNPPIPANPATNPALPEVSGSGTCGYGDFPNNTSNTINALDTNVTPGDTGSITFWFNSKSDWDSDGDRILFDASNDLGNNSADKQFFMLKRDNHSGSLWFVIEDSDDRDMRAEVRNLSFSAGTWVHIAVTWDLPNDRSRIYVNGVLRETETRNMNGTVGNIQSLYIGDNRTNGGIGTNAYSNDSANGYIDEFKIYSSVLNLSQVNADYTARHACTSLDHYAISYNSTPGIICEPSVVTITAHADPTDHNLLFAPSNTTTIALNSSPAADSWSLKSGGGSFTPPNLYTFDGTETSVEFYLTETTPTTAPHIDIDVTDGVSSDLDGDPTEDANLQFTDTAFRFLADITDPIGPQIAGKESNIAPGNQLLQVQAIRTNSTSGACEAGLSDGQSIEMAYECLNPTTCQAGQRVQINNTTGIAPGNDAGSTIDISNGNFSGVTLDFGTSGIATFTMDYDDVGSIRLFAREQVPASPPNPAYDLFGTSNDFVVRPFGLDLQVTTANPPHASDATGNAFTFAGEDFTLSARAVAWNVAGDSNFDGVPDGHDDGDPSNNADLSSTTTYPTTPSFGREGQPATSEALDKDIVLSATLVRPSSGGSDPGLSGTTTITSLTSGSGSTTVSYEEVGVIEIAGEVSGIDYLGGGDVIGKSGFIGRFIPWSFSITPNVPSFADSCSGFTYLNQPFYYATAPYLILQAHRKGGATVDNYGNGNTGPDGFVKFSSSPTVGRTFADGSGTAPSATLSATAAGSITLSDISNSDGDIRINLQSGSSGDEFMYQKNAEEAPFDADVDINFLAAGLTDSDGVCYASAGPSTRCNSSPSYGDTGDDYSLSVAAVTTELRYGRLFIGQGFGSELLPLTVPFRAEYYDGNNFVLNTLDSCSLIDDINPVDGNPDLVLSSAVETGATDGNVQICSAGGTSTASLTGTTLASGNATLSFTAPGTNCTGYAQTTVDLSILTGIGLPWLQYDWDNSGTDDDDPLGRASFGIYKGPTDYIYIREPWN